MPLTLLVSVTLQGWGLADWSSDRTVMAGGRREEGEKEKERGNDKRSGEKSKEERLVLF